MAKKLEDAEFWLPAEILGGDDELFLVKGAGDGKVASFSASGFPSELSFGFAANLDSPVESVTDDEEEDYMAGLTKQMAHYFLQDDDKEAEVATGAADNSKAMAGSPQSTLCAWSASSNRGSPNGPSLVSSPPTLSPLEQRGKAENPRDLLHEAAGQVMRLRLDELGHQGSLYERGILRSHMTPPIATAPTKVGVEFFTPNPVLSRQEIQTAHFYHLKRQQEIKQQSSASASAWAKQTKAKSTISGGRYGENLNCRPLDLPASAWPPLGKPPTQPQQPPAFAGSGMRAVFLHTAGARKESAGTGVFLPRTAGNKFEPKKKSGCSTVLVPDRVVQALNLNLDEFAAQPRFPGGFVLSHGDSSAAFRSSIRSVFLVFLSVYTASSFSFFSSSYRSSHWAEQRRAVPSQEAPPQAQHAAADRASISSSTNISRSRDRPPSGVDLLTPSAPTNIILTAA